jgi:PhoPQ-activated pathogenicity-related protein
MKIMVFAVVSKTQDSRPKTQDRIPASYVLSLGSCVLGLLLLFQSIANADLLQYVAKEDASFKWEKVSQEPLPNDALKIELKLTSQTWKGILLEHRLRLIKPKEVKNPTLVSLFITGSGSGREELIYGSMIATSTGSPVAILHDVPYQPLFGGLKEDDLIAYTLMKTLETGDEEWPLLFPMTKTAVRAMDAIQEFSKQELGMEVSGFVVAGGSKRGWTTWFTAAVDERVKGIIPAVYDNLDLVRQMEHQLEAWGDYSEQISEYTKRNIPQRLSEKGVQGLSALVDPYTYRERITVPKLIVIGTNDDYWPLDALNLYYDDLVGEKYILYVPNKDHGVEDAKRIVGNWVAFFLKVEGELKFPKLSWDYKEKEGELELSVRTDLKPVSVSAWTTESPTRDFRDAVWQRSEMTLKDSAYRYILEKPEQGYAAIFSEAIYKSGGKEFFLSTNMYILKSR